MSARSVAGEGTHLLALDLAGDSRRDPRSVQSHGESCGTKLLCGDKGRRDVDWTVKVLFLGA